MMKKIMTLVLCMLLVFSLVCCTVEKTDKETDGENTEQSKADETNEENKSSGEDGKDKNDELGFVLDVKPLEETDEEVLVSVSEKLGFGNKQLFHSFANAIGKKPEEVTQADVDKIHYIALGPDDEESYSLFVGYVDYIDLCFSDESSEPDVMAKLNDLVMMSEFVYDEDADLSDLKNFRNVEMFEIYDVKIDDVSFITQYDKLIFGYFRSNGITDVSSLADYNPASLVELDFTGNNIHDWSPLTHIQDKVIVVYDLNSGFEIRLDSYLDNNKTSTENADTNDNRETVIVDSEGNPADFSSLFD